MIKSVFSTGNVERNLRKQANMIRERKNAEICCDEKKKAALVKTNNTIWGKKSECTGKRRKTKKISILDKTIKTQQDILKRRKNSTCKKGKNARRHTNNQMTRKQINFGAKIWERRVHNREAKWISNKGKELKGLEGPKAYIHLDSLKAILKKSNKLENTRPW